MLEGAKALPSESFHFNVGEFSFLHLLDHFLCVEINHVIDILFVVIQVRVFHKFPLGCSGIQAFLVSVLFFPLVNLERLSSTIETISAMGVSVSLPWKIWLTLDVLRAEYFATKVREGQSNLSAALSLGLGL